MSSYSALVVNDNKKVNESYIKSLETHGYKTKCFSDLNSAFQNDKNKAADLLMIDFKIGMSGDEVEKAIVSLKKSGYRGKVVAVFGDGEIYKEIRERHESNGKVKALKKPFNPLGTEFRDAVRTGEKNE